ncbi:MAG: 3-isopropylmalate dehydratase small subunit [Chromatiales bacterium]|nr:3-isopropylmalate dehydratase small subunit [Chromatiales bacterium]
MQAFTTFEGLVAPLDRSNVDTDAIIPKQFLKSIRRSGFGPYLFDDWRYKTPGEYGMPASAREEIPDFVLNQPRYRQASILLARENFGCGSSREHAVWALTDFGFRVVIAPSFADIFYNNCFKNGLLPIVLDGQEVDGLFDATERQDGYRLSVDLPAQRVVTPDGHSFAFDIDAFRKERMLEGLDDIGLTLRHADEIRDYESRRRESRPWLFESSKV